VSTIEKNKEKKEVEESRRRKGSTCGQATKGTANREGMEEEFGSHPTTKGTRALWRGCSRKGTFIGVGIVYPRSGHIIFSM